MRLWASWVELPDIQEHQLEGTVTRDISEPPMTDCWPHSMDLQIRSYLLWRAGATVLENLKLELTLEHIPVV